MNAQTEPSPVVLKAADAIRAITPEDGTPKLIRWGDEKTNARTFRQAVATLDDTYVVRRIDGSDLAMLRRTGTPERAKVYHHHVAVELSNKAARAFDEMERAVMAHDDAKTALAARMANPPTTPENPK
jgi:hypothetical protein